MFFMQEEARGLWAKAQSAHLNILQDAGAQVDENLRLRKFAQMQNPPFCGGFKAVEKDS
jgi:hypothetical protein